MNQVVLIGRLARDPETRYSGETAVTRFTIATDKGGKDKGADFIKVTVFGRQGENVQRYMSKGRQIGVLGHLNTGSYEKNGEKVYTMDVIADRVEFLGKEEVKSEFVVPDRVNDAFQSVENDIPF